MMQCDSWHVAIEMAGSLDPDAVRKAFAAGQKLQRCYYHFALR